MFLYPVEAANYDEPVTGAGGNATAEMVVKTKDIEDF